MKPLHPPTPPNCPHRASRKPKPGIPNAAFPPAPHDPNPRPAPIDAESFFSCDPSRSWWLLANHGLVLALALAGSLWFATPTVRAAVAEVGDIELTVASLDRSVEFYTRVLPFELVETREDAGPDHDRLLDLDNAQTRSALLRLGQEGIRLTEHVANKGRPIPSDSRSHDLWFQHIAIVVSDMDRAYAGLRAHKVRHVSTGPQTLPDWNPAAGGIRAFYFRDPEDHVLEIIWYPNGKGDPRWQQPAGRLYLGIDHTAIVVSDTDRSAAFYRDVLGFKVAGESENFGVEQEHLNQVFGARLRITGLRAPKGPGIEFLEYITPPGGRPLPADARANDLVFWQTHLLLNPGDTPPGRGRIEAAAGRIVSRECSAPTPAPSSAFIARDPDGHALNLSTRP